MTDASSGRLRVFELGTRRLTGRWLSGLRTASYIRKWLMLGVLIGIVAGLGAVVFYGALHLATHYLLGSLGGYSPATTAGEGGIRAASGFARPWAIPLVVALGGLVSGLLVFGLAPEAEGHGTDAAIHSVHTNPKGTRPRVTLVKIVASAVTIGSGGSGGREGPTAQISASFGSILARALNLTPADSRIAVSAGIASGIAAIFRAPLGGAILGAELLYRDDVEVEALIPSLVASVVGYAVFGGITGGFTPIFGYHSGFQLQHAAQLGLYVLLGLAAGLVGRLYVTAFYRTTGLFGRAPGPRWLKPAVAGLAVGALGLAVPGVLGTGYGQARACLARQVLLGLPLWVVLAIPFAKILATSLSIGSGGSGGIFGPGMVIGGATGAAVWRLLDLVGMAPHDPVPFVIVGMTACFGAIAHAPLAVMLMVAEMTGNLALLAPAMVAIVIAVLVVGDTTIYRSQLRTRADSAAHRFSFGLPASASVALREVMAAPRLVLPAAVPARQALTRLRALDLPGAPVVNDDGAFLGSLQTPRLAEQSADRPDAPVGRLADVEAMTVPVDAALDAAVDAVATSRGGWVPVLDSDMRVVGIVASSDLVVGWRMAMRHAIHRLGRAARNAVVVETTVTPGSAADGARVADLALPRGAVLVAVHRGQGLMFADAGTLLCPGDLVSAFTRPGDEDRLRLLLTTPAAGPAADPTRHAS
jgi:chloride channel protein, CIC family